MTRRILYNLFRPVYQRTKQIIKKFALKLLSKVDDAFLENYKNRSSQGNTLEKLQTYEKKYTPEQPTIIFNEGGSFSSPESIHFVFKSIFKNGSENKFQSYLWTKLSKNFSLCTTHEMMVSFLKKEIIFFIQSSDHLSDEISEAIDALNALDDHIKKTHKSRNSYLPSKLISRQRIVWPDPTVLKDSRSIFNELPFANHYSILDNRTPIGSAGSCFAMEIAHKLQANGYNYIVTEPYPNNKNGYSNACARWGTIFNVPCFRQLIESAFSNKILPRVIWSGTHSGEKKYYDPFREDIAFESVEEYESSYLKHQTAAREALLKTKVFILTLGMNEIWRLKIDGSICSRSPWRLASYLVEPKILTVEENVNELEIMLNLWRKYNPDIQLIISVSPVPLHATFRGNEQHIISANCHSKSTLRVASEIFCNNNQGVYYFPSYETVMYCTKNAWEADQRHVSREAVDNVMSLFQKMFLKEKDPIKNF